MDLGTMGALVAARGTLAEAATSGPPALGFSRRILASDTFKGRP